VATLGINPSSAEFLDRNGVLLAGSRRRLATLDSLGVGSHSEIDDEAARAILDDCATYFERRPYGWFNALDRVLEPALGVSYRAGTACHLDLVQWATDPIWKRLPEHVQVRLLSADRPFLEQQLQHDGFDVVIVAGRTAMAWVEEAGLVRWREIRRIPTPPSTSFVVGDVGRPRFLGWSCNLQSQPGASRHASALIELVREHLHDRGGHASMDEHGMLAKGTHFGSRDELVSALERWFDGTDEETIGDAERFKRAPWINADSSAGLFDLNADTSRRAVGRMLAFVRSHPGSPWLVVENQRGRVNKVVFDPNDSHEGWYAYLRHPLPAPSEL
jgi:hypothetical protein